MTFSHICDKMVLRVRTTLKRCLTIRRMLKGELKRSWSHLFDIKGWLKSGKATCDIYEDAETKSHNDDKYIETVPLI